MKPSIGRMVTFIGISSNGAPVSAAIITRVFSDQDPIEAPLGTVLVNLTVFPDLMTPQHVGSVPLFDSRADADAHMLRSVEATGLTCPCCYWPERV